MRAASASQIVYAKRWHECTTAQTAAVFDAQKEKIRLDVMSEFKAYHGMRLKLDRASGLTSSEISLIMRKGWANRSGMLHYSKVTQCHPCPCHAIAAHPLRLIMLSMPSGRVSRELCEHMVVS